MINKFLRYFLTRTGKFNIFVSNDVSYKEKIANLKFENNLLARLSCDSGIDLALVEVFHKENDAKEIWKFNYHDFIEYLQRSYEKLKQVYAGENVSVFPKATGDAASINEQGQYQLDDILKHPEVKLIRSDHGGAKLYAPDGRGAYFKSNGTFRGFLEYDCKDRKFKILISSDLDYEEMVINLDFGNDLVAILSCDNGIDNPQIELFDRKNDEKAIWKLNYQNFLAYLQNSYDSLKVAKS